jgi:hypothetical protein
MARNQEISTLSTPNLRNWSISGRSQSRDLYALALVSREFTTVTTGGPVVGETGAAAFSGLEDNFEFIFNMNPRAIAFDEPASVQVVPTQDGSQFIEHQGSIYKMITISGTTGVRPNGRGRTDLIPIFEVPNPFARADIDPEDGLPRGEASGFEDLIRLRNLFRHYFDIKRDPTRAHLYEMVWQNGKEGEFWVVEPMAFRTNRESSSPLTATYDIQLRTIRRADFRVFQDTPDVRTKRNALSRLNERLIEHSRTIANALGLAESLVDRTVGIGQATLNSVISPATALFNGLTGVTTAGVRGFAIPRNSVAILAGSALDLVEALQTVEGELNAYKQQGISTQLSNAFGAYKNIFRTAARVHDEDQLFSSPTASRYNDRTEAYRDPNRGSRLPRTGGSPTNPRNVTTPGGSKLATVTNFDTIFSVAQRLLGDQARWKELVMLNDLKAPYIDPSGDGKDVLRPGDKIMVPSSVNQATTSIPEDLSQELDPVARRLGRDIKLQSFDQISGGLDTLDFAINSKGDLALHDGVPNLSQAIRLKFSTEQGTLATHPSYGIRAPIGSKVNIRSLVGFQLNARASLLADSRISKVQRLSFNVVGNTLNVRADLQIADVDQGVAVSFDARR